MIFTGAYAGGSSGGAAAAAAAVANAIKASGAIVKLDKTQFAKLLARMDDPLIVTSVGGFFSKKIRYLTSYKGLFLYCESADALSLPSKAEVVTARNIWIPG